MRRLLLQVGHVDPDVADLVREGFPLVGWLPRSGLWDADCEPPSLSVEALTASAEDISSRSVKGVCRRRDAELEPAIWAATVEESSKGWLTFSQDGSVPESHVVSSRFGVKQKNKIRPIGNFKSSCVNAACGVQEKVAMDGIDEIVSLCLHWLRRRKPLSAEDRILGRTWDLKSAYKQLAVKREHKRFALICVVDPESNRVRIAEIHSMPFGAVAAVNAFLRCGLGIKAIGRGKLHLVMTNFFDDFTVLASRANCKHVQLVVSFLFRKLGWDVAPEEKKNAPFAEVFDVLGVRVYLCKQQEGKVSIKNTPDRLAELQADVSRILENGSISYEESQRLRGRFLFAEQNVWGRNSRQAIVAVGDVPDTEQGPVKLSHTQVVPRPTTRLWLDGACEWDHGQEAPICGFGGVLMMEGGPPLAWGATLSLMSAKKWAHRVGKQQLVFECELLPYLLSLQLWSTLLRGTDLLVFIDNDAARASLAKSFTRKEEGARIVHEAVHLEEQLDVQAFFMRVPTFSNIADGPSRGDFSAVFRMGGRRVALPPFAVEHSLGL